MDETIGRIPHGADRKKSEDIMRDANRRFLVLVGIGASVVIAVFMLWASLVATGESGCAQSGDTPPIELWTSLTDEQRAYLPTAEAARLATVQAQADAEGAAGGESWEPDVEGYTEATDWFVDMDSESVGGEAAIPLVSDPCA